ncbi:MAG: type II toxin-antitoxin system PemK/MazF family toxin [Segetibacter sp.]
MADLNPVVGSEQSGIRPVVIISGEIMNQHYSIVIMCPLTSKIKPYKGCPVITPNKINNLTKISQTIPFHVRTISKIRLTKRIGFISDEDLKNIKQGLEMFLTY